MSASDRRQQTIKKQAAPPRSSRLRLRRARIALAPAKTSERRLPLLFRQMTLLAALALTLPRIFHVSTSLAQIGVTLAVTFFLLMFRLIPVAWTRERPLTFVAPVVLAVTLWIGPTTAAMGALLAGFLHARFGPSAGYTRSYLRFQGAQTALAALAAGAALASLEPWIGTPLGILPSPPDMTNAPKALNVLGSAAFGALVFTAAHLLLGIGANLGALRAEWRSPASRARLSGMALVYALGMLPVLVLSPLGAEQSLMVALPLLLLLLAYAQVARLTLEVHSLRGQLETAEKMGRASVTDVEADADPAALLNRFLALSQDLVVADRALVWTMNQETGELTPAAALPDFGVFAEERATFGEGLIGHAAVRIRPRLVADAARDPRRGRREVASGAWLLYPIVVHERLLGVAQWIRPVNRPFTQEDVLRLDSLVPQAAIALENVRIREAMLNMAATDGLTGLWNHRRMHELLRREMDRSSRYHRALSALMLDVDSFKTFNDTYGHPQGDRLLRSIAAILHSNVRTVDYVGRYGGEEFLVILPETSKDDACRLAERIRSAVEERAFIMVEGQEIHRTVSVGVAAYPEDALNPSELVQRADEALYRAKRAGKNRVLWA